MGEEEISDRRLSVESGPDERCEAVFVSVIDIDAMREEELDRFSLSRHTSREEGVLTRRILLIDVDSL